MENQPAEGNQNQPFQLQPLSPEEHAVSTPPRRTTDLPFFYLTKKKELLNQPIRYEGIDESGRPIRWTVTPNTIIGAPAIDAHRIWHKLIIPTIEQHRTKAGRVPQVLPLGGVRKCLRLIGWTEGGRQAREFLAGLNRIASAWCEADFFVPVQDANGKLKFAAVKGKFSRLSIYAIGEKHLTEEELTAGKFDFHFDLDATVYLQLHHLEILVQENQDHRYIDNRYMFSVEPTARRWLEIMGPKIFGVVKNNGTHCEIRYSWYVKHHHTLERQSARFRMVEQMNRIVAGHIASGYILKPEYRTLKEPDQEIDLLIRYYPGPMARESTNRIRASLNQSAIPEPVLPSRAGKSMGSHGPRQRRLHLAPPAEPKTARIIDYRLVAELAKRGVGDADARQLLSTLPPEQPVLDQLEYGDYQIAQSRTRITNPPGFYISLLQRNVPVPATFESSAARNARQEAESAQQQALQQQQETALREDEAARQLADAELAGLPPQEHQALFEKAKAELMAQYPGIAAVFKAHPDSAINDGAIRARMRALLASGRGGQTSPQKPQQATNPAPRQADPLQATGLQPVAEPPQVALSHVITDLQAILSTPQLPTPAEPTPPAQTSPPSPPKTDLLD